MNRRDFGRRILVGGMVFYFGCDDADGIGEARPDGGPSDADPGPTDLGAADAGPFDLGTRDAHMVTADADVDGFVETPDAGLHACDEAFAGGEYLGRVPFTGGRDLRFHELVNEGWDGRLYTDLSLVERGRLATPNAEFYVRTRFPDQLDLDARMPWSITVTGDTEAGDLELEDFMAFEAPMGLHVLECSGNGVGAHFGLLSAAEWDGIPIQAVLDHLGELPEGAQLLFGGVDDHSVPSAGGHSTPGAEWIFTPEQLLERGAFLATRMNGEALPLDHGFPVRLFVPGWYGCVAIKWLERIEVVSEDAPSTSQMREFASRTHQDGVPAFAQDFKPAEMHQAAMPTRIERWRVDGQIKYRVIGILWGGFQPTDALQIRFAPDEAFRPVDVCPQMTQNSSWTVWSHAWTPQDSGDFVIRCAIDDDEIPTQRLDRGFYDRFVTLD